MSASQHKRDSAKFFQKFASVQNLKDSNSVSAVYNAISSKYDLHMGNANSIVDKELVNFLSEQIELSDNLNKNCSILDVGCGTGLVGQILRNAGFTGNLEGVDGSQGMIDQAVKLENVYSHLYTEILEPTGPTSLPKQNYDVIISSHTFFPHHLTANHFEKLFSLLRVGGFLIFNLKYDNIGKGNGRMASYVAILGEKISELIHKEKCEQICVCDLDGVSPRLEYIDDDLPNHGFVHEEQYCLKKI